MDISPEYIKMCDCPEIQGHAPEEIYHFREKLEDKKWWGKKKELFIFLRDDYVHIIEPSGRRVIWIPRQDQLQEMVDGTFYYQWNQFYKYLLDRDLNVGDLISDIHNGIEDNPITWGQLWLAFVMCELHNKKWDGEKWIRY